jgi:hypothetical protein
VAVIVVYLLRRGAAAAEPEAAGKPSCRSKHGTVSLEHFMAIPQLDAIAAIVT